MIVSIIQYRTFKGSLSYKISYRVIIYSINQSKITPGVCPGTKHTDPLMPIGGHPANTMASQGLSWDWWQVSQVQNMGVDRLQDNFKSSILQYRGNNLQYIFYVRSWGFVQRSYAVVNKWLFFYNHK